MKIKFGMHATAEKILENAWKLIRSDKYKMIYINRDMNEDES